jgi:hypothetical protein
MRRIIRLFFAESVQKLPQRHGIHPEASFPCDIIRLEFPRHREHAMDSVSNGGLGILLLEARQALEHRYTGMA